MAGSINKAILIGNVGRDPEVRFNPDGGKIVTLSIATNEYWKDKTSGERRDRTEWHRVVVFNEKLAEVCEKYLKKGSKVYLEGRLRTRKWTDQEGHERYTTEIVLGQFRGEIAMLDTRKEGEEHNYDDHTSFSSSSSTGTNNVFGSDSLNDEIPF